MHLLSFPFFANPIDGTAVQTMKCKLTKVQVLLNIKSQLGEQALALLAGCAESLPGALLCLLSAF